MKTQLLFKTKLQKMAFLFLFAISFNSHAKGLCASIPDVNFETKLIALGLDSGPIDHLVLKSSIAGITSLNVSNSNIQDMTGIQFFVALQLLYCQNNQLTNLDVSNNIALGGLECGNNQLTNLYVTSNFSLIDLYCYNNQLTSLNVYNNGALTSLICAGNQLTSLDVNYNTGLNWLLCQNNQLTNLDVSNNHQLNQLNCSNNQLISLNVQNGNYQNFIQFNTVGNSNLNCIQVDNENFSNQNWQTSKDVTASYSTDCSTFLATQNNNIQNAKIYPNPTKGLLNIDNINLEQVKLYNTLGEEVNEQKYLTSSINNTIDLSALATGIYFARFESNGKISTQKIIKE